MWKKKRVVKVRNLNMPPMQLHLPLYCLFDNRKSLDEILTYPEPEQKKSLGNQIIHSYLSIWVENSILLTSNRRKMARREKMRKRNENKTENERK